MRFILVGILISLVTACTKSQPEPQTYTKEVARHIEGVGESSIVTRVIEERTNGIFTLRVQVIKDGEITETVHTLESKNFSISIPVSAHIIVESTEAAQKAPNTSILRFSQKLETAREAMLKTEYVRALEALNGALQIDSYNPRAHMMKGSIFYAMGKYDLAKKEFDYVLKLAPDNIEVKRFKEFMESSDRQADKVKLKGLEEQ